MRKMLRSLTALFLALLMTVQLAEPAYATLAENFGAAAQIAENVAVEANPELEIDSEPEVNSEPETDRELETSPEHEAPAELTQENREILDEEEIYRKEVTADDLLYEVEELRESDTKHYRLRDGAYIAVQYDTAVHYKDEEDKWVDIDNSLEQVEETVEVPVEVVDETDKEIESSNLDDETVAKEEQKAVKEVEKNQKKAAKEAEKREKETNKEAEKAAKEEAKAEEKATKTEIKEIKKLKSKGSVADIKFAKNNAEEESVSDFNIQNDEYSMGFSMVDGELAEAKVEKAETNEKDDSLAAAVSLPNLTSIVKYEDVLDGIDLEYVLHGRDVKENIIVKKKLKSYEFSFDVDLQNLKPVVRDDGSISMVDKESEEEVYFIPPPFMEDEKGVLSEAVKYELIPAAEFYQNRAEKAEKEADSAEISTYTPDSVENRPRGTSNVNSQESSLPSEAPETSEDVLLTEDADDILKSEYSTEESKSENLQEVDSADETSNSISDESSVSEGSEPDIEDSEAEVSGNVYSEEIYGDNQYVFTVIADEDWMEEKGRAFPVTIDPPVVISYGKDSSAQLTTSYVQSGSPNTSSGDNGSMYMGYASISTSQRNYMYARVNQLPTLPSNSIIVHAGIYMCNTGYSYTTMSSMKVPVYALETGPNGSYSSAYYNSTNGSWMKSLTWNNKPYYLANALDYATISSSSYATYVGWDITGVTKKWYSGALNNYGLAFIPLKENTYTNSNCGNASFAAYNNNSFAGAKPKFMVQYRNDIGLESYYSYDSQSVGRAGTAYVSDHTGQLTLTKSDAANASTVLPFELSHVYNTAYAAGDFSYSNSSTHQVKTKYFNQMLMGKGWKLSAQESILEESTKDINDKTVTYLVHNDSDGTVHYYAKDSTKNDGYYYDEDGLNLKISKSGTTYTMEDDKKNKKIFRYGFLSEIQDRNGNYIYFIYNNISAASGTAAAQPTNGAVNKLVQVRQKNNGGTEEVLANLGYDSSQYLSTISDRAGNVTRYYYDSSRRLTQITHADGTYAFYAYDSAGKMTQVTDNESGARVNYGYNASINQINSITQYGQNVLGEARYRNGSVDGYTKYRGAGPDNQINNSDDIMEHLLFDYAGRTVNYYITDVAEQKIIGASTTKYTSNSGVKKANNRPTQTASIGTAAVNLLQNYSAEGYSSWTASGSGMSISTAKPRTGSYSQRFVNSSDARYYQTVSLTAGNTYTLSAYINTSGGTFNKINGGAHLYAETGSTRYIGDKITSTTNAQLEDGWQRINLTFTPSVTASYSVGIELILSAGTIYADDFQLELGSEASNVNMVQNGGFEGTGSWTYQNNGIMTTSDKLQGSRSLIITGSPDSREFAYQDIAVNLPGSETFVLSGWAKANSVPTSGGYEPAFNLYAQLTYTDGVVEHHLMPFNPDLQSTGIGVVGKGWQYGSTAIVPKIADKTVKTIRVLCHYNYNANTVYFDNISLVRELAQTYKYNDDGKLVSVAESKNKDVNYSYSGANLIKEVTKGNGTFNYSYDTYNNLKTAKNDKLTMSVTYDGAGNSTKSSMSSSANTRTMNSTAAYTDDKNRVSYSVDVNGSGTYYGYDSRIAIMNGTPTSVKDSLNRTIYNIYNSQNGRIDQTYQSGVNSLQHQYDQRGRLSSLARGGYLPSGTTKQTQYYNFAYDNFNNVTSIGIGGMANSLATYSYGSKNGNLSRLTYGNGKYATYSYDYLDRLNLVMYNDGTIYQYSYNGDGMLDNLTDSYTGRKYSYSYDTLGRLINFTERKNGAITQFGGSDYDTSNRMSKFAYGIPELYVNRYETYSYNNQNGTLSSMRTAYGDTATYTYDPFNRLETRTVGNIKTKQGYVFDGAAATDSMRVAYKQYTIGSQAATGFTYNYDAVGNITSEENKMTGFYSAYTYDNQNQLKTESVGNAAVNYAYNYTYDTYGNIRSKTLNRTGNAIKTDTYTYGNSSWLDLLTAYNGSSITYDAIGNPTKYHDGSAFTWEKGRRLQKAVKGTQTVSYSYDVDGIRTDKTVNKNGVVTNHKYYTQNNKIVAEKRGNSTLEFIYDESGNPLMMIYGGTPYYYVTNHMGDVVRLVNSAGTSVAEYTYNAWGDHISSGGSMASINPLRYRGYYFDEETGLYYLNSRYYDPKTCRFINADDVDVLDSARNKPAWDKNLFAYCDNNPVMREDKGGEIWHVIAGGIVGAAVSAISQLATNLLTKEDWNKGLIEAGGSGLLSGALAATGLGPVGQFVGNALISGVESIVTQGNQHGYSNIDFEEVFIDAAFGGTLGAPGGAGKMVANHLSKQAKNSIKKPAKALFTKGVKAAAKIVKNKAKYYAKHTYKLFYKPLARSFLTDTGKGIAVGFGRYYIPKAYSYIYSNYALRYRK